MALRTLMMPFLTLLFVVSAAHGLEWNPSDPPGGSAVALVGDGAGRVWVATEGGGVFRSTDGGTLWTAVNQGLGSRAIGCLERAPSGRLWAGTEAGPFGSDDGGVWRTADAGQTWQASGVGSEGLEIVRLAADVAAVGVALSDDQGVS